MTTMHVTTGEVAYVCETMDTPGTPRGTTTAVHRVGPPLTAVGQLHWLLGTSGFILAPDSPDREKHNEELISIVSRLVFPFDDLIVRGCPVPRCGATIEIPRPPQGGRLNSVCGNGHPWAGDYTPKTK